MVQVAPVRLQVGPKVLWFDPNGLEMKAGDAVLVNTKRGTEYGILTTDVLDVSDELIAGLKSPLQKVIRVATPEDEQQAADMEAAGDEALGVFCEMVDEAGLEMHPVLVEYLFDGDKAVFYFESEERVDFRDLVRKLAAHFHVRVDMRQIGVRDGARIIGGLGHCGQELCCKRLGGEFSPVTIRMAKEQNLSLNQPKISGICGRLMCCLRYEYDVYKEFNAHAPKMGAKIDTPDGVAKVVEVNVPNESITLLTPDGKRVRVPLSEFDPPDEGNRPKTLPEEAYERHANATTAERAGAISAVMERGRFNEEAKLADPQARAAKLNGRPTDEDDGKEPSRRKRRRRSSGKHADAGKGAKQGGEGRSGKSDQARGEGRKKDDQKKRDGQGRRRKGAGEGSASGEERRSRRPGSGEERRKPRRTHGPGKPAASSGTADRAQAGGKQTGARPGQRSSGLSGQGDAGGKRPSGGAPERSGAAGHRKPRNRSHGGRFGASGKPDGASQAGDQAGNPSGGGRSGNPPAGS